MSTDINVQLQNAVAKKKTLSSELQKLQGKLELAKSNLAQVETECEELGVDPSSLEEEIQSLTEQYEKEVSLFVSSVNQLEQKLSQYKQS